VESLGNFPDPFLAEVAAQPEVLRGAAAGLAERRGDLERLGEAARRHPAIVFTAMGSSYHACYPAVSVLAAHGVAAVHVAAAELLHFRLPILAEPTLLVVVSQSGRSAEAVGLVDKLSRRTARPFLVSVTNGLENPVAARADLALDSRAGPETGPSTITFAASLTTLSAVARVLALEPADQAVERSRAAAEEVARTAERLLEEPATRGEELLGWLGARRFMVLLGRGPARAAAEMGALTVKEVAGFPAEALEAAQFRHGPLELAGTDLAALVFATEPETRELDLRLASDLVDAGAAVLVVSASGEAPAGARAIAVGNLDRAVAPAASIVPVQLLSWRLALDRGRRPGMMTRAAKVTTRE
jgi:glucosamine--fructose-6-phosphate aminotransferase (isomerizing)